MSDTQTDVDAIAREISEEVCSTVVSGLFGPREMSAEVVAEKIRSIIATALRTHGDAELERAARIAELEEALRGILAVTQPLTYPHPDTADAFARARTALGED